MQIMVNVSSNSVKLQRYFFFRYAVLFFDFFLTHKLKCTKLGHLKYNYLSLQPHQKPIIMAQKESGYRKSIDEIESILTKIESGETDIDNLAVELKRASELLQECREKLFLTEQEVEKIMKREEGNR